MSLFEIINVILPLYLLIGLGFVSIWWGWFPAAAIPGFGKFVRNFALPSAIFLALAQREMDEVLHLGFLLAFGIASVASFLLSLFFARRVGGNARRRARLIVDLFVRARARDSHAAMHVV